MAEVSIFLQQLYNSLALASIYTLVAIGITLVYGLTRLVNFAHGQMLTLGAFIAYLLATAHWPFLLAAAAAMVVVALVGEALDLGLFRRTLGSPLTGFMVSLGLIAAMEAGFVLKFGEGFYQMDAPFRDIWQLGPVRIDQPRLLIVAAAVAVGVVLFLLLERTDWGRAIRALAEDGTAARTLGVPVGLLISVTFMVGSACAALAGALLGTVFPVTAFSGSTFLLKGFAVAIIGGLGNVAGAVVASLLLALTENLGAGYISVQWVSAFGLGLMTLILVWRPTGLFRGTESGSEEGFGANWALPALRRPPVAGWAGRLRTAANPLAIVVLVVLLLPAVLPTARSMAVATTAVITAIIAYSLWLTFHHAGIFSIVQGALVGAGAYMAGILGHRLGFSFWLEVPFSVLAGATVAFLMGVISLRASASYFLILTFALSELVIAVLTNWQSLTGGPLGLLMPGRPDALGPIDFNDPVAMYYLVVAFLLVALAVIIAIERSAFGRRLHTIRDNERLARSLGLNTFAHKLAIFTIGGAVAGLAGCLYLYQQRYVEPTQFSALAAINIALVVILGGIRSGAGPIVGAFVFGFLPELLQLGPNQSRVAFGILLIVLVLVLPGGVMGGVPQWRRLLGRGPPVEAEAVDGGAHVGSAV
jgi:branched-subunit amino acid ABC-type transport system permease component